MWYMYTIKGATKMPVRTQGVQQQPARHVRENYQTQRASFVLLCVPGVRVCCTIELCQHVDVDNVTLDVLIAGVAGQRAGTLIAKHEAQVQKVAHWCCEAHHNFLNA